MKKISKLNRNNFISNIKFISLRASFWISIYFILFSTFITTKTYADSLQDFIATQKTIRIVADDAPGSGDQAASLNIIHWLRENRKYTGDIEFIYGYGDGTKEKIISLFNLPKDIPDDWSDPINKIRFIKNDLFITLNKNKQMSAVTLGINGGLSDRLCAPSPWREDKNKKYTDIYTGLTSLECSNYANFYNTDIFIQVSPYPQPKDKSIGYVDLKNDSQKSGEIPNLTTHNTYIPVAVNDITVAKKQIENNADLLSHLPALANFVDGIINQDFNVLPVYSWQIQRQYFDTNDLYLSNMLQIIAAASYAQQKGLGTDKPLIIAVFYNYDYEANILNEIIHGDNWETLQNLQGLSNARAVISQLGLQDSFLTASLSQPETITLFQKIKEKQFQKPRQIILLSIGSSLPKDIFDALYVHTGTNVWPQIREGANSFNSLVTTGKPHFRCGYDGRTRGWEMGDGLMADLTLRDRFNNLYFGSGSYITYAGITSYSHDYDNEFCNVPAWENHSLVYQELGDLFIDAANPNSALSLYFQRLKVDASQPENDRIARTIEFGLQLLKNR